jgi:Spy/CpxP family protein refolding chaperone
MLIQKEEQQHFMSTPSMSPKTTRGAFAFAAILTLASASLMQAQPQGRGGGGGTNRIEYLTGYLTLTDAQVAQAKTIFDAESTAITTARGQLASAQTALSDAVKASKSDAELDRLAAAAAAISGNISAIHAKSTVKFAAILTSAQRDKFFAMQDRAGGGMRPFGRGPRGM